MLDISDLILKPNLLKMLFIGILLRYWSAALPIVLPGMPFEVKLGYRVAP